MGVLLFAQPVAAQSGAEMLRSGVCGTRVAPMVGAVWGAGVLIFAAYGVYRGVTGISKMGGSDPGEVTEGRERVKGAFYSFGASLLLLSSERVLAFVGIPLLDCINLGFL